ncbi:TonB-dependent receptor domain-containing protein [Flavobacterium sp.]|uniref:TonB-dependent receptor domain-containing protein n=1 Tax=Flavobacterium sp. TaxID=239 RepID=UPI003D2ACA9F
MSKYIVLVLVFFGTVFNSSAQEETKVEKEVELKEVIVVQKKKAIEQKADRTIFDFSEQPQLNSGSVLEGLKKLPGLIISDVAGMMYQGKQLEVYLDGRPLNIYSNELNSFLEGMPANSIEKVEVITQPGAEFPATSGGAIINIITSRTAKNYLSATYSSGVNFTDYDKTRARFNNSLLLNAKNKYFGWQLNIGQNYRESAQLSTITNKPISSPSVILSDTDADRVGRSTYVRSALKFDLKRDRLLLNYDVNFNNNDAYTLANGFGFNSDDFSKTKSNRQDVLATYQKYFDDVTKKLEFRFNFNRNASNFNLDSRLSNVSILDNSSLQDYFNFRIDYSQEVNFLDQTKISVGTLVDELSFEAENNNIQNLYYTRRTAAAYAEFQTDYKNFKFILGSRAEDYLIKGNTDTADLTPFKQFKFFPNASAQYNFDPQIFVSLNYNKKISLPSTSALNPNNTNYQNPNVDYSGNPQLQPTIFDNLEMKISAFDYAFVGYSVSSAKNQVVNRVSETSNTILNTSINVPELRIHNFNIGLPIPYMLFTKGLAETLKFDFNPDKINFLYAYASYQMHEIPNLNTKGFWIFNFMSQILLPKDISFIANYNYSTPNGNYYYFIARESFSHSLDFTFSKKFLNDNLSVAINFDDILNTNQQGFGSAGTDVLLQSKNDTRRFGFTLNYKIPTKNKLAKVDPSLLNNDKKEEGGLIGN